MQVYMCSPNRLVFIALTTGYGTNTLSAGFRRGKEVVKGFMVKMLDMGEFIERN